jgi:hypothetical protein
MVAPRRWTTWDRWQAKQAAKWGVLGLAVAVAIAATKGLGQYSLAQVLAAALPAAPLCSAWGTLMAMRGAHRRGELVALEALGQSPLRRTLPAVFGGGSVALLAFAFLFLPQVATTFADVWSPSLPFRFVEDGPCLVELVRRLRVCPDSITSLASMEGMPRLTLETAQPSSSAVEAWAFVAMMTGAMGLGLSAGSYAASVPPLRLSVDVLCTVAAAVGTVVAVHRVVLAEWAPWALALPAFLLLVRAYLRYPLEAWRQRR